MKMMFGCSGFFNPWQSFNTIRESTKARKKKKLPVAIQYPLMFLFIFNSGVVI
jgi:hypothetical protein